MPSRKAPRHSCRASLSKTLLSSLSLKMSQYKECPVIRPPQDVVVPELATTSVHSVYGQCLDGLFEDMRQSYEHDAQRIGDFLVQFALVMDCHNVVPFYVSFLHFRIAEIVVDYLGTEHAGRNQNSALAIVHGAAKLNDGRYFEALMRANALSVILEAKDSRQLDDMDLVYETLGMILCKSQQLRDQIMSKTNLETVWTQFMSPQLGPDKDKRYALFLSNACSFPIPDFVVGVYTQQVKRFLEVFGFKRKDICRVLHKMSSRVFFVHEGYQTMLRESGLLLVLTKVLVDELKTRESTLSGALMLFANSLEEPVDFELPWDSLKLWIQNGSSEIVCASLIAVGNAFESMPATISSELDEDFENLLFQLEEQATTKVEALNVLAEAAYAGDHSVQIRLARRDLIAELCELAMLCGDLLRIQIVAIENLFLAVEKDAGTAEALDLFDRSQGDDVISMSNDSSFDRDTTDAFKSLSATIQRARASLAPS